MILILSLLLISASSQLTFHSKLSYPFSSSSAIIEQPNGIKLQLPHEGWVVSDSLSKTTSSTFYATLLSFEGVTRMGAAEIRFPHCSFPSANADQLKGSTGCFIDSDISLYTNPRLMDAGKSIPEVHNLEINNTYKWEYKIGSSCLLPQIAVVGDKSVVIPTIFSNECQDQFFDVLNKENGAYFEVLGSGSAEWCIQTESQYNNNAGVCDPKIAIQLDFLPTEAIRDQDLTDEKRISEDWFGVMLVRLIVAATGLFFAIAAFIVIRKKIIKRRNEKRFIDLMREKDTESYRSTAADLDNYL